MGKKAVKFEQKSRDAYAARRTKFEYMDVLISSAEDRAIIRERVNSAQRAHDLRTREERRKKEEKRIEAEKNADNQLWGMF